MKPRASLPVMEQVAPPVEKVQDKITIDEVRALQAAVKM